MEYQALLDDIVNGQCLPVIGAGFSKNAKTANGKEMPDWRQLADVIKQQLNTTKSDPMEVLQEYVEKFDRSRLIREIERVIPTNGMVLGEVHKYFVKIPSFDLIYTTNFDLLLEDAFKQESKKNWKPLVGEKSFSTYASPPTVNIVKMHGDLHHVDHLVITKKDYEEYMTKYAIIATHLSASLITRTPLFIGYSLTDPNFRHIWEIIQDRLGEFARRGFIVLFDATQQEKEDYKKFHLSVIDLKLNGRSRSDVLLEFLKEICTYATTYNLKKDIQSTTELEGIQEEDVSVKTPSITHTFKNASLSEAIQSIGLAEKEIHDALEKSGVNKKELKKSLTGLCDIAFQLGLLSSSDIGFVRDIMAVRNQVVHSGKDLPDEQVKWIINGVAEIRKKISDIVTTTSTNISVEVAVDSKTYTDGDIITITGKVKPVIKNLPLTVTILDPNGTLVQILQSDVDDAGRSISITKAIGALWEIDGTYTVRARYGIATVLAEDKFEFKHRRSRVSDIYPMDYNNKLLEVPYSIRGGILRHMEIDPYSISLRILIESSQDGDMTVDIPRILIDAKTYNEDDDKFIVMIDGTEVNHMESITHHSRILTIRFLKGNYTIEIIGNRLSPLERILASSLRILDEEKKSLSEIIPNHPVVITTFLINNQTHPQKYTLIIQIQKDGITVDNLWIDGILRPGESSEPHVIWTPIESGEYSIQAFVWETIENPSALSSPQHLRIKVVKVQNDLHKPVQNIEKIISDLDTIIEIFSSFPPTRNQLNDAIKLYDACWHWAKENIDSKYEINVLKTNPVSIMRLLVVPNPSRELKATTDELIIKAKRLKKIITQEFSK